MKNKIIGYFALILTGLSLQACAQARWATTFSLDSINISAEAKVELEAKLIQYITSFENYECSKYWRDEGAERYQQIDCRGFFPSSGTAYISFKKDEIRVKVSDDKMYWVFFAPDRSEFQQKVAVGLEKLLKPYPVLGQKLTINGDLVAEYNR